MEPKIEEEIEQLYDMIEKVSSDENNHTVLSVNELYTPLKAEELIDLADTQPSLASVNSPTATLLEEEAKNSENITDDQSTAVEATMVKDLSSLSVHEHQYSMNVADYHLGAVIGFGSSAIVYMATYLPLNTDVAVKMIELDHFERNRIDELRKEIQVMALCKHSNLLGILTSFVHESKLWIVTPFLSGGSCLDIIKSGFRDGFDEAVIATILVQALHALVYLHEHGHIHRDLKCGNLLMAEDGLVQLADFGVSSSLLDDGDRRGVRKTYVGTPCWMAPEVMEITRGYDFKADIWSFGITALELAYGHAPYAKFPPMKVIYLTLSGKPPTLDRKQAIRKYSRVFKEMVDSCLQRDPAKRPTAKQLLKHPFFKSAKKLSFLQETVLIHVPPVHQRDKSAQLKARGFQCSMSPVQRNTGSAANSESMDAAECFNEDTSDSWDFSVDDATSVSGTDASPMNTIVEEDEDATLNVGINYSLLSSPVDNRSVTPNLAQSQGSADDSSGSPFHGLQKSRTSRFIVDKDRQEQDIGTDPGNSGAFDTESDDPHLNSTDREPIAGTESVESSSTEVLSIGTNSSESYQPIIYAPHPAEVKKGRFSVLESVNGDEEDSELGPSGSSESPALDADAVSSMKPDLMDEEKRSRFEVTTTEISQSSSIDMLMGTNSSLNIGAAATAASAPHLPCNHYYSPSSNPAIQSLHHAHYPPNYHYQAPPHLHHPQYIPPHVTYNPYFGYFSHYPGPVATHPHMSPIMNVRPQQTNVPTHHHQPSFPAHLHKGLPSFSTFYSMPPPTGNGVSSVLPIGHIDSISATPIHGASANQLEHLLQMNDYIRLQLVELQANTATMPCSSPLINAHSSFNSHLDHSASLSTESPYAPSSPLNSLNDSDCPCVQCQKQVSAVNLNSLLSELEAIRRENEHLKSQIHGKKEE